MRRWLAAVLASCMAGPALTGCGAPAGLDGDLTDDWGSIGDPQAFVPPTGVCYPDDFAETAYLSSFSPVDCTSAHRFETVHVGAFGGAAAGLAAPPAPGSAELRTAFGECDASATGYVGDNWRAGRLWLGVATPSPAAWTGGARWFRCDLLEVNSVEDDGDPVTRTATLKGALAGPSPLRLGCYGVNLDAKGEVTTVTPAACAAKHNSEFAGVWMAPDVPFPAKRSDWERFYTACRTVIAGYVGLPADAYVQFRTGVLALPGGQAEWKAGNRGVRCYLWLRNRSLSRSMKGAGPAGLPIQYR